MVKARIALLTNGIVYQFYADLDEPNVMDSRPFLTFDLTDIRDNLLLQLKKITKQNFDLEHMLTAATDLKYMTAIRTVMEAQLEEPDEEFVRFFFSKASPGGRFTASAKEQFNRLVKQAFTQFISDRVGSRLRTALEREDVAAGRTLDEEATQAIEAEEEEQRSGIETTEEELEGFRIIRAIVCSIIDVDRVHHRDTKSYFGVLIDDNNRKPVCRLHLNRSQKYLGLFDDDKNETRHPIESVQDLYRFADELRVAVQRWVD